MRIWGPTRTNRSASPCSRSDRQAEGAPGQGQLGLDPVLQIRVVKDTTIAARSRQGAASSGTSPRSATGRRAAPRSCSAGCRTIPRTCLGGTDRQCIRLDTGERGRHDGIGKHPLRKRVASHRAPVPASQVVVAKGRDRLQRGRAQAGEKVCHVVRAPRQDKPSPGGHADMVRQAGPSGGIYHLTGHGIPSAVSAPTIP